MRRGASSSIVMADWSHVKRSADSRLLHLRSPRACKETDAIVLGSLAEELDWFPARDSIYRQSKCAQLTAVLPSASQEANKFILARTMHGEVPHAFVVLALLLMDERSNSAEPSNMSG